MPALTVIELFYLSQIIYRLGASVIVTFSLLFVSYVMYLKLWLISKDLTFFELLGLRIDTLIASILITFLLMSIFYAGFAINSLYYHSFCLLLLSIVGPLVTWLSHMSLALHYDLTDEDKLVKLLKPKRLLALIYAEIKR